MMNVTKFIKERKQQNRKSLLVDSIDSVNIHSLYTNECNREHESCSESNDSNSNGSVSDKINYMHVINEKKDEKKDVESICKYNCDICNNKSNSKDAFIILTCEHIFHIKCLVETHYADVHKYGVIDEEYFNSRKCVTCNTAMEMEDIMYIHNKFYKNTKEYLVKQDEHIDVLNHQMNKLKEELRICYEYKQRLEHQREKSKQITITLNTLM